LKGKILRLYPLPARGISAIYEDLDLPPTGRCATSRPYVIVNMVSSVDGRTTVEGKSSPIGSEFDRQTMRTLRSKADAVMIGGNTLRAERLSLGLDEPESGRQPLAVIMTKTADLPLASNLILGTRQEALVITTEDAPASNLSLLRERAHVQRLPPTSSGGVNLYEALRTLRAKRGVDVLVIEGGPRLNHSLIYEGLADELFLTLAPTLSGGERADSLTVLEGPELLLAQSPKLELISIHLADGEVYLRYRL
jgi:2,5-diamino-6-(ribosylamino)-4(3H)-pyrimidinone 5'-phosphate reductase